MNGRTRIENAALELFASEGIENASTREIARRAGVAEGTLYRHFQTKEELAERIFLTLSTKLTQRLDAAVAVAADPADRIRALVDAFFHFASEEPQAYEYITHRHPQVLPGGARLPKDAVVDAIRAGMSAGAFRGVDPVLGAALVIGMVVRSLFFLRHGLLEMTAAETSARVARAALRVLKEES